MKVRDWARMRAGPEWASRRPEHGSSSAGSPPHLFRPTSISWTFPLQIQTSCGPHHPAHSGNSRCRKPRSRRRARSRRLRQPRPSQRTAARPGRARGVPRTSSRCAGPACLAWLALTDSAGSSDPRCRARERQGRRLERAGRRDGPPQEPGACTQQTTSCAVAHHSSQVWDQVRPSFDSTILLLTLASCSGAS